MKKSVNLIHLTIRLGHAGWYNYVVLQTIFRPWFMSRLINWFL